MREPLSHGFEATPRENGALWRFYDHMAKKFQHIIDHESDFFGTVDFQLYQILL